jgi:hypothetical protein
MDNGRKVMNQIVQDAETADINQRAVHGTQWDLVSFLKALLLVRLWQYLPHIFLRVDNPRQIQIFK